jgi:predicted permease
LLSLLGGALGVVVAFWGVDILGRFLPHGLTSIAVELRPDLRVLGFTLGTSLVTGLLFGLAPAIQSTRPDLVPALKNDVSALGRGGWRFELRKVLVISQVALSLLLLIGAGLFIGTLENLKKLDLGFNAENVLLLSLDPSLNGYRDGQVTAFYAQLLQRVEALPGVETASLASGGLSSGGIYFSVEGYQPRPGEVMDIALTYVEPKFFETMGMALLLGRDFGPEDNESAPKVVIVNERVARRFFGNQSPIGKRIGLGRQARIPDLEIIGVVGDARYHDLRKPALDIAYLPFRQFFPLGSQRILPERTLLVRATGKPKTLMAAIRREVQALDKDLPVYDAKTFSDRINELLIQERLIATLSSLFSLVALLLASIGLYGTMAYAVVRRTNEIGIRMALGAQPGDVLWLMLREAILLVLLGVAIGVPAALALSRLVSSFLYGLTPTDPVTLSMAIVLMVAVATFAGYLPARRASRTDPIVALRYE